MPHTLRVFDDLSALSDAALVELVRQVEQSISARGRFTLVLSGGDTPRALYARLAQHPELPWPAMELWFGDERAVPLDHPASNAGMVRAVLSSQPFIPQANVQRMRTELAPAAAAAEYEQRLRQRFEPEARASTGEQDHDGAFPRFDLVLLGLGSDGHTASLFPHSPVLHEAHAWACSYDAPPPSPARITLTYPVLNRARALLFLVSGEDKAEALRRVLEGNDSRDDLPARGIAPVQGTLLFFVDRAAASALSSAG